MSDNMKFKVYQEKGYESRAHYLRFLAEEYDLPLEIVYAAADVLGPDEDFDGLISMLDDASYLGL